MEDLGVRIVNEADVAQNLESRSQYANIIDFIRQSKEGELVEVTGDQNRLKAVANAVRANKQLGDALRGSGQRLSVRRSGRNDALYIGKRTASSSGAQRGRKAK